MNLKNQNILIIGGATGMGLATAKLAEELGAKVCISGHNKEKNKTALSKLSDKAESRYVDVVDSESINSLFSSLEKIDHIFITAAPGGTGDFIDAPIEIKDTYIFVGNKLKKIRTINLTILYIE